MDILKAKPRVACGVQRFLLVDDNPMVRARLAAMLRQALRRDIEVLEVESAESGLRTFADGPFQAVFFGLGLAGKKDGLDFLRDLAKRDPEVSAIVHSSRPAKDRMVSEALSLGAAGYLPKPVRLDDVERLLRDLNVPGTPASVR